MLIRLLSYVYLYVSQSSLYCIVLGFAPTVIGLWPLNTFFFLLDYELHVLTLLQYMSYYKGLIYQI